MLLSAEQITKSYGTRPLLDGVSIYLERGMRIGVVGLNGAGKSTLLRLLAGKEEPDDGTVTRDRGVRLEYLPQIPVFEGDNTILEQVFAGLSPEARSLADYEAKTMLNKLGLPDFNRRVASLSGGEKRRIALASVLVHPCDILILDEPTNHLDSEMVEWLENYLKRFTGALVMVTHDRYFLERVVTRITEVDGGKLYSVDGNYSLFLQRKLEREASDLGSERKRQAVLRREYQWVMQGATARGTKSRERLSRYDELKNQSAPAEKSSLELSSVTTRLGKTIVELNAVSKAFEGRKIINAFDYILLRDDRVGIVGSNGSGKSTLLNLIAGRLAPDSGSVVIGDTVRIGYFSQETPPMNPDARVIDFVKAIGNNIETPDGALTASQLLEQFLFPPDAQWSPIGKLSGGERRRLFLLSILVTAPNILLLDEPTNDFDLQTLSILEDYLEGFPGAVVAVSHDRYFLDRVARKVFALAEDGIVSVCPGGYREYHERMQALAKPIAPACKEKELKLRPAPKRKLRFTFGEQREFEAIDDDIAELEARLEALKAEKLGKASDYLALSDLENKELELTALLDAKTERWVYLTELAEQISADGK